jgi:O-antigen ligase/tetratricopeptide (TPR) repeat protein
VLPKRESYGISRRDYRSGARSSEPVNQKQDVEATSWFAWLGVLYIAGITATLPWFYGGATFKVQYWLFCSALVLGIYTFGVFCFSKRYRTNIPFLSWILIALAGWAIVQAQPRYELGMTGTGPNSVRTQRWFLGENEELPDLEYGEPMTAALAYDSTIEARQSNDAASPRGAKNIPARGETEADSTAAMVRGTFKLAISMDPAITRASAGCLLVAAIMLWAAATFFKTKSSIFLVLTVIVISGICVAVWGFAGRVAYDPNQFRVVKWVPTFGGFISKNSAGAFLNVAFAAALGLFYQFHKKSETHKEDRRYRLESPNGMLGVLQRAERGLADARSEQIVVLVVMALIAAGVFASFSRGATLSFLCTLVVVSLYLASRTKGWGILVGGAAIIAIAAGFLAFLGLDESATDRFSRIGEEVENVDQGRRYIWAIALKTIYANPWVGIGLGGFRFGTLPFQSASSGNLYAYAENFYLHAITELGLIAALAFGGALLSLGRLTAKFVGRVNSSEIGVAAAALFVVLTQALHSMVDFALVLPAVFVPVTVMVGMAIASNSRPLKKSSPSRASRSRSRRNKDELASEEGRSSRQRRRTSSQSETSVRGKRLDGAGSQKSNEGETRSVRGSKRPSQLEKPDSNAVQIIMWFSCCVFCLLGVFLASRIEQALRSKAIADTLKELLDGEATVDYADILWAAFSEDLETQFSGIGTNQAKSIDELRLYVFAESQRLHQSQFDQLSSPDDLGMKWRMSRPMVALILSINKQNSNEFDLKEYVGGGALLEAYRNLELQVGEMRRMSPLSSDLAWLQIVYGYEQSPDNLESEMNRGRVLFQYDAAKLRDGGWIASAMEVWRLKTELFVQCVRSSPRGVFGILKAELADDDASDIDLGFLPSNLRILVNIADNYLTRGKFPEQNATVWLKIAGLAEDLPKEDGYRNYIRGRSLLRQGNSVGAKKFLEEAVILLPRFLDARLRLIDMYLQLGDLEQAQSELDTSKERFKDQNEQRALQALGQEIEARRSLSD